MALHVLDEANRCLGCKKPMCQQGCNIIILGMDYADFPAFRIMNL